MKQLKFVGVLLAGDLILGLMVTLIVLWFVFIFGIPDWANWSLVDTGEGLTWVNKSGYAPFAAGNYDVRSGIVIGRAQVIFLGTWATACVAIPVSIVFSELVYRVFKRG